MPEIFISCPVSGDLVPTGVPPDQLDPLITIYVLVGCQGCGAEHMWIARDAVLAAA